MDLESHRGVAPCLKWDGGDAIYGRPALTIFEMTLDAYNMND